jgi:hypothetical protein
LADTEPFEVGGFFDMSDMKHIKPTGDISWL